MLSDDKPVRVKEIIEDTHTLLTTLQVRSTERGMLESEYAAQRVWTLRDGIPTEEWLLFRGDPDGRHTYALSNASAETTLEHLAWMESQRYFVERSIQDAKSELGWDEFQAWKFRAWDHHTAMTILASWFITQTKPCAPRAGGVIVEPASQMPSKRASPRRSHVGRGIRDGRTIACFMVFTPFANRNCR